MTTKTISMEYINPWYGKSKIGMPPIYKCIDMPLYKSPCGRGFIIKISDKRYDYMVNERVVTQRCGKNMQLLELLISHILDEVPTNDYHIQRAKDTYTKQTNKQAI